MQGLSPRDWLRHAGAPLLFAAIAVVLVPLDGRLIDNLDICIIVTAVVAASALFGLPSSVVCAVAILAGLVLFVFPAGSYFDIALTIAVLTAAVTLGHAVTKLWALEPARRR